MNDAIRDAQVVRDTARQHARVMQARASAALAAAKDAWDAVNLATKALDDAIDAAVAAEKAKGAPHVHP